MLGDDDEELPFLFFGGWVYVLLDDGMITNTIEFCCRRFEILEPLSAVLVLVQ